MEEQVVSLQQEEIVEENRFPFFRILYKNIIMIILVTILGLVAGTMYGLFSVKPTYKATCNLILNVSVSSQTVNTSADNSSYAKAFMPSVADFITTPKVIEEARKLNGDYGISGGAVNVEYNTETLIFSISYSNADYQVAERRLTDVITASKNMLGDKNTEKPLNVKAMSFTETQNRYIASVSDNSMVYVIAGFVGGLIIAVSIAILIYVFDNKVKDVHELERITNVGTLSIIDKQDDK